MTQHFVEVHAPSGPSRRYRIPGDSCILGHGDDVAIVLPSIGDAPFLRLECDSRPHGMRVRAESPPDMTLRFRGTTHQELVVPWNEDVFAGPVRLCFMREAGRRHPYVSAASLVASVVSLAGGLLYCASWSEQPTLRQGRTPPALAVPPVQCPTVGPRSQVERADEATLTAHSKQERFPFDPREGTIALYHLALAWSCYAAAGESHRAEALSSQYEAWRLELEVRVRTMLLTLEEDVAERRFAHARHANAALRELLYQHSADPFVEWLRQLDRWLAAELKRSSSNRSARATLAE